MSQCIKFFSYCLIMGFLAACGGSGSGAGATTLISGQIGSEGGVISTDDGAFSLTVPANVLAEPTEIELKIHTPTEPRPGALTRQIFELSPAGLTFSEALKLRIHPRASKLAVEGNGVALAVLIQDDSDEIEVLEQVITQPDGAIDIEIPHFSTLVLGQYQMVSVRFEIPERVARDFPGELPQRLWLNGGSNEPAGSVFPEVQYFTHLSSSSPILEVSGYSSEHNGIASQFNYDDEEFEDYVSVGSSTLTCRQVGSVELTPELRVPLSPDLGNSIQDFLAPLLDDFDRFENFSYSLFDDVIYGIRRFDAASLECVDSVGLEDFEFAPNLGVQPGSQQTSNAVTLRANVSQLPISVSNGLYAQSCPGGPFLGFDDQLEFDENGEAQVCVRHTAAGEFNQAKESQLSVGDKMATFRSVTVENQAPVGQADEFQVLKNNSLQISAAQLLVNDSDPEGQSMTLASDSLQLLTPDSASLDVTGQQITVVPNNGFEGQVHFNYQIRDAAGALSEPILVIVFVVATNQAPIAENDEYSVIQGNSLNVAAPGILSNDSDPDGDQLRVSGILHEPLKGVLTWQPDGSFVYTPDAEARGNDNFIYQLSDGTETVTGSVSIQIAESPACNNSQPKEVLILDQGATASEGDDLPAGTRISLTRIVGGALYYANSGNCAVAHLKGPMRVIGQQAEYTAPERSSNDALGENCDLGEVVTEEECLDPLVPGEVAEGAHVVTDNYSGTTAADATEVFSMMSQVESLLPITKSGSSEPSVSFATAGPVHGPLVFTGLRLAFRSGSNAVLDLSTGRLHDVPIGLFSSRPSFAISENEPGSTSRSWAIDAFTVRGYHPDVSGSTNFNGSLGTSLDAPYGYSGNFRGQATGYLMTNGFTAAAVSFRTPTDPASTQFEDHATVRLYDRDELPGANSIAALAAVQASSSPALLLTDALSPSGLYFHPGGESTQGERIGDLGNGSRLIRCLDGNVCVALNNLDSSITSISWDGQTSPIIGETRSVVAGANSIALYLDPATLNTRVVVSGENNAYSLVEIDSNGTVIEIADESVPAACPGAQRAIWFDDPSGAKLLFACADTQFEDGQEYAQYFVVKP